MGTSSGAYELNHECASKSDLITRTKTSTHSLVPDKTRYICFISILTRPYLSNVQRWFFGGKAYVDRMSFG